MKFRILFIFALFIFISNAVNLSAQTHTALAQITNSSIAESFAGGVSGDGRFVVIESRGNIATENPRNTDGNREIFLFDYAQRRIFQITDTKSVLKDTTVSPASNANIKIEILNSHPVISRDGRWIAFESNATTSKTGAAADGTNPGSFDGNTTGYSTILQADGNIEIWLYQVPTTTAADLTSGAEIPVTNLGGGTFTLATNTAASALPLAGSVSALPFIAEDNHDVTISNDGNITAFASTRTQGGNVNVGSNDEIFTYKRDTATLGAVTETGRNTLSKPFYSINPTISGDGTRVMFASTANNPVVGSSGGSNADFNEEVFYANLADGVPTGSATARARQVSVTAPISSGDVVNLISIGPRMSNDGRYIGFDSLADLTAENGGTNYTTSFALFVYDTTLATFKRVGPRSNADTAVVGGDVVHYPNFTVDDAAQPFLVYQSRFNLKADGSIPATATDGLNSDATRPPQIYSYPLAAAAAATFTRLTNNPPPTSIIGSLQPLTSANIKRIVFNFAYTETGTGNSDFLSEAYYLLTPNETSTQTPTVSYFTGASGLKVFPSPVPTPTVTPTPSPSPSPTATPVTPDGVQGLAPGMLATIKLGTAQGASSLTAVGSLTRRFTLPVQLGGVSVTFNGIAAGIKSVTPTDVTFVVPPELSAAAPDAGVSYSVIVNYNGSVITSTQTLVLLRPDVFTKSPIPGAGGRARAFNATNRVPTPEPFTTTTYRLRGGVRVATVLRVYMTGLRFQIPAGTVTARIGNVTLTSTTPPVLVEPGVYTVDFNLTSALNGAGDQPLVVTVIVNGVTYTGRLDDTASRISIL